MDFDQAKENIQPLACGRDAKRLEIALNAEQNDEDAQLELNRQRKEYENAIQNYKGDDPLELWFDYICWVEQCYPKSGKECAIDELLVKCLTIFEHETRYFQDRRLIKLYIKYIDSQQTPIEFYQQLYNAGIGTMVADLYICWAHYYDIADNYWKANEIYSKGLDARAEPLDELKQSHTQFNNTIGPRMLNQDKAEVRTMMEEKRHALTSLKTFKRKHVGSIRTGSAVKSLNPGKVGNSASSRSLSNANNFNNENVNVYVEDGGMASGPVPVATDSPVGETSVIHSIIDKVRHQENRKEPGPWSKPNTSHRNRGVVADGGASSSLGFAICEDTDDSSDKLVQKSNNPPVAAPRKQIIPMDLASVEGIKLSAGFIKQSQPQSITPSYSLFIADSLKPGSIPCYDKMFVYPGDNDEYSPEEIRAWRRNKRLGIDDKLTRKYDSVWASELHGIRLYPEFGAENLPQPEFKTQPTDPQELLKNPRLKLIHRMPIDHELDPTIEDHLAEKWMAKVRNQNKTIIMDMSLEMTIICDKANEKKKLKRLSNLDEMMDATNAYIETAPAMVNPLSVDVQPTMPSAMSSTSTGAVPKIFEAKPILPSVAMPAATSSGGLKIFQSNRDVKVEVESPAIEPRIEEDVGFEIFVDGDDGEIGETVPVHSVRVLRSLSPPPSSPDIQSMTNGDVVVAPAIIPPSPSLQQPTTVSSNVDNFLVPKIPVAKSTSIIPVPIGLKSKKPLEIGGGDRNDRQQFYGQPPTDTINLDDTACSTQNFNFFIKMKSHGASTPLAKQSREPMFVQPRPQLNPVKMELLEDEPAPVTITSPKDVIPSPTTEQSSPETHDSSINSPPQMMGMKQLSTIMETSETNTVSSNANTKSSVDDQLLAQESLNGGGSNSGVGLHTLSKSTKIIQLKENQLSVIEESSANVSEHARKETTHASGSMNCIPSFTEESLCNVPPPPNFGRTSTQKAIDDLFDEFSQTPPRQKVTTTTLPTEPAMRNRLNESVTIPALKDILAPSMSYAPQHDLTTRGNQSELPEFEMSSIMVAPKAMTTSIISKSYVQPTNQQQPQSQITDLSAFGTGNKSRMVSFRNEESQLMRFSENKKSLSIFEKVVEKSNCNITQPEEKHVESSVIMINSSSNENRFIDDPDEMDELVPTNDVCALLGRSIYVPMPEFSIHDIDEDDDWNVPENIENSFVPRNFDLNVTKQSIDQFLANSANKINPFDTELCTAFLDEIDFVNVIEKLPCCTLVNHVPKLSKQRKITINDEHYSSVELIAKGAYGFIYKAVDSNDRAVAIKQERPPNFWEYYISLIIRERINPELFLSFAFFEHAMIGNNSSIYVTEFVKYGTLLDVCNKIHSSTSHNLDELITIFMAIEMFSIIDHLHGADIIHGDIKPDNFMLMSKLSYNSTQPFIKLVDYGNSVDMTRFPGGTVFTMSNLQTEDFICTEMKEGRPWTYQTDFFCLAATLFVLLFGRYMKPEHKCGKVTIGTTIPRYFRKRLWDHIFTTLLNIPNCQTFPNLQELKVMLKEVIAEEEKQVINKISEFNRILISK